ncbi:MAG: hypothetical protein RL758_83 [Pseudomonadota bacterium]|jgi:hypothetical protein
MDVNEIRMRNYTILMQQFRTRELDSGEPERGLLNRFGEFTGVSPRYLSHVNNSRKHLGPETCRRMEQAFKLPHGWMDHDHLGSPAPGTRAEREYLELALKLFRESPLEAQSVLLRYMGERMIGASTTERPEGDREQKARKKAAASR